MASLARRYTQSSARAVASSFLMTALVVMALLGFGSTWALAQNESPMLAERVAAGELPPVEERLPENPLVVEPVEQIGQYGGTWRFPTRRGDWTLFARNIAYENLVRWNPEWTEVIPNVAESVEINEDSTQFTFSLRPGMRWSDGEPFTADDILFWYENILMDERITTAVPSWLMAGEEPVVVEKLDDYTVVFTFAEPSGFFLQRMATSDGYVMLAPKHFLQQFHPDLNPDEADTLAGARDYDTGIDYLQTWGDITLRFEFADVPVLWPWRLTAGFRDSDSLLGAERNPFYFKVDPEGNQLPYIDNITFPILDDVEVIVLRALNYEYDFGRRYLRLDTKPLFFDAGLDFVDVIRAVNNTMVISLNLTHEDPVKREIFQNKDFRSGLSHAINRQELIDLAFVGQGQPWQPAPRPDNPVYNEQLATQYLGYDLDLANEYLDRAGYTERDGQGYRLGPDGNRISFAVEVAGEEIYAHYVDMLGLISDYWREVGIDMHVRNIERGFFYERKAANQHDANVWSGDGGMDALLEPRWYFPYSGESNFAIPWANWYNGLPGAQEPPEAARRQMELYDRIKATADQDEQVRLMQEIMEIAAEEFYVMGISMEPDDFAILTPRFKNVPAAMPGAWLYPDPAPTNPEQYFILEE
jgi:peptide/nickel transport system substrate-binding protein